MAMLIVLGDEAGRADDAATVATAVIERRSRAETDAEFTAEIVVDDDDARFDLHLSDRNVQRRH